MYAWLLLVPELLGYKGFPRSTRPKVTTTRENARKSISVTPSARRTQTTKRAVAPTIRKSRTTPPGSVSPYKLTRRV